MKVAVVTQFPMDPQSPCGGVEAVSVNLVRSLAALQDLDIHVVTLNSGISMPVTGAWAGATLHRLPRQAGRELANATGRGREQIRTCLADLRPDLIHAHDTYGLMVKGLALPRVFTIHGFIYGDTLVSGQRFAWLRSKIWKRAETAGWADQAHIISISPYVRERLNGIATGMIYDIDNPIGEAFFDIRRTEQPGTVFSAAAVCPRKNTLRLVQALNTVVHSGINARLRIAGPVTDAEYGARVSAEVEACGLQDRVIMLGQISTDQIEGELARASVFALVSLEENSPMGIEEAMAAGVPVLTSNRCGMPYMVRHGESGYLVNPLDVEDIARRLTALLVDGDKRRALGEVGREIALDRFHPQRVAGRTRLVYEEAVSSGIGAAHV